MYVLPAGMYAGQVWGTEFIEEIRVFTIQVVCKCDT